MIRCASYNCNSIRNNAEIVKNILGSVDILFLQEIMLNRSDLDILNNFDNTFDHDAYVKDKDALGINEGRPTAGVAIFWKRNLSLNISTLIINDSLIGIKLDNGKEKILLLNVYLPCDFQNFHALDKYRHSLAMLKTVIDEQNISKFVILGDFNADPSKGRFWRELMEFSHSLSLKVVDSRLPDNSFTYLCPSKNTTSWLDHILCTQGVLPSISGVYVDYDGAIFDHFPLYFCLEFCTENNEDTCDDDFIRKLVNWSKISNKDKEEIKDSIDEMIDISGILSCNVFRCIKNTCTNENHTRCLDEVFDMMVNMLLIATNSYSCEGRSVFRIIPGWNDYVKESHAEARE